MNTEKFFKLNMNDHCLIKPTEKGKEAYINHKSRHTKTKAEAADDYARSINEDGYMHIQLWEAFEIFGSTMSWGCNPGLETTFYMQIPK